MTSEDLERLLRSLAAATAESQAPERVEQQLRHAFRARAAGRRAYWLLLAAACLVAAVSSVLWLGRTRPAPPPVVIRTPPPAPEVQPAPAPSPVAVAQPRSRPRRARRTRPVELVTDFIPLLPDTGLLPESGQVVRVRLPRTALVSFGLPMNEDRISETVKADVVFGEDGIARAIRFVR